MIPGNFPPIGTVLATRSGGFSSFMIRMGAALRNKPNLSNHIAVMHHVDQAGVPWAIEGKPGGVGWVDARNYLKSKWTITNESQNLPTAARPRIAADMEAMLGRAYDWPAIFTDALNSIGIPSLFAKDWKGTGSPGHVVCSSLAAWLYAREGCAHPAGADRYITPGDWNEFIQLRSWEQSKQ